MYCLQTASWGMGGPDSKGSPEEVPQVTSFEPESWSLLPRSLPHRLPALLFVPQTKCPAQSPAHIEADSDMREGQTRTWRAAPPWPATYISVKACHDDRESHLKVKGVQGADGLRQSRAEGPCKRRQARK